MFRRRAHIISEQEQECMDLHDALRGHSYMTPEDVSREIHLAGWRTYSPAKVLEIAEYCARVRGNVEIRYNYDRNYGCFEKTVIRWVTPDLLAWETDKAIGELRKALQGVRAWKVPFPVGERKIETRCPCGYINPEDMDYCIACSANLDCTRGAHPPSGSEHTVR